MISNPVLRREFITSLRSLRAVALGVVFLGILTGLVIGMWPEGGMYSVAAQSSHKIFIILSMTFLALVVMVAPSFTAVSITTEKEQDTYDLLYDTLLRPDEIVFGKLVAGVGYVLFLIAASLPMSAACLMLGGIAEMDVLRVYAIVGAAAVFFGLLGLFCSTVFRSSYRALIFCYAFMLAICGVTWVPSIVLGEWAQNVHAIHLMRSFSPFAAMSSVVYPQMFAGEHPITPSGFGAFADGMWSFMMLAAGGSLLLLLFVLYRVSRPPQPRRHDDGKLIEDRMELIKRHVKFPFYLLDPRKRKRMIGGIFNVIAVKEMRSKAFGRAVWVIRSLYACFMLSLLLAFLPLLQFSMTDISVIIFTCVSLPLAIIVLMSPVLTASAITEEVESGIFDMLRSTRIGAWTLVMGKIQVAWLVTLLLLTSTFPTFFVLTYVSSPPQEMEKIATGLEHIRPFNFRFSEGMASLSEVKAEFVQGMASSFAVLVTAMIFATAIGIAASAFCKRSSTATAVAYGCTLAWAVGTLLPHFLGAGLPEWLTGTGLRLNPFVAAAKAATDEVFRAQPPDLWVQHVVCMLIASAVLLLVTMIKVHQMMRPQK